MELKGAQLEVGEKWHSLQESKLGKKASDNSFLFSVISSLNYCSSLNVVWTLSKISLMWCAQVGVKGQVLLNVSLQQGARRPPHLSPRSQSPQVTALL